MAGDAQVEQLQDEANGEDGRRVEKFEGREGGEQDESCYEAPSDMADTAVET